MKSAAVSVLVCLAIGLALAACAVTPPTEVGARDDPFRPYREVVTAAYAPSVFPGHMQIRLAGHIDRQTGAITTLFKVKHNYLGKHRHNYEIARNERAQDLKLTVIARYGGCRNNDNCPLDELYTIEVPEADLRTAGKKGYRYKVFPRVGPEILITLPPETIDAFLALLDKEKSGPTMAAAAARKSP